jgi:hypothetical protein
MGFWLIVQSMTRPTTLVSLQYLRQVPAWGILMKTSSLDSLSFALGFDSIGPKISEIRV